MKRKDQLSSNLAAVRTRIERACAAAGRANDEVRLVAVTKYVNAEVVRDLHALGVADCGESRPQVLWEKAAAIPELRWHLVGHLQRNKVERTLPLAWLIHSVDSLRLLDELQAQAVKQNRRPRLLLEIHLSGEEAKQGFTPRELDEVARHLPHLPHLEIAGLMTMAAQSAPEAEVRRTFAELRTLRETWQRRGDFGPIFQELSMGMTGDFEAAILEGATCVRVGTALFDGLAETTA